MDDRKTVFSNLIWRFSERCGAQLVSFLVSIVLARLLDPEVYGTIALITVITTILQVFVDSGLGNALIQKKDADDVDFSTVFYFNMAMCICLYLGLFAAAPWIAEFYEIPELTPMVRVLGLTLVVSGVKNVQQAYVSKHMLFKKFFFATLGGTIAAAVAGIVMALMGFGPWALITQYLVNLCIDTVILWLTVDWKPKLLFSLKRLRRLLSFGWKLLASALLETLYNDLRQMIIGKKYSAADLGYYNRGQQAPELLVSNINSSISSVLLPAMAERQSDRESLKAMTRRAIKTSSFVIWPMMVGLGVCAEPLIRLMLTEKWLPSVPFMRIFCFSFAFYPIHTSNLNAINALGRSDIFLRLEIEKKVVGLLLVVSTMWFGVMAMAYSLLVSAVISGFINAHPNKKLLGYSYSEQLRDILPSVALSAVMGALVYPVIFLGLPDLLTLAIQVIAGAGIYILGAKLLRLESFLYLLPSVQTAMRKIFRRK